MASLRQNLTTTLATQCAGLVLGVIGSVVINRTLQPEGKGWLATYVITLELLTAFASFGLPKAVIFEIGQDRSRSDLVAGARVVGLINGLVLGLFVLLAGLLGTGAAGLSLSGPTVLLAAGTAAGAAWMAYLESILRGLNEIWKTNVAALLRRTVYFLLPLLLLAAGRLTVGTAMVSYLAAVAVAAAWLQHHVRRQGSDGRLTVAVLRSFLRYGLKYQAYSMISQLHVRLDVLIVGWLLTAREVGYYSTAANLAQLLWNLPTAASFVIIPYIANRRLGDDASLRTAEVTRSSTLLLAAAGVVLAATASWLVPTLYGAAFAPAVRPLRWLLPGVVAFGIVRILGAHLIGRGRLWALTLTSAGILAANVVLNVVLIPRYGVSGAAMASTLTYGASAVAVAWLVSREGHVSLANLLIPSRADGARLGRGLAGSS